MLPGLIIIHISKAVSGLIDRPLVRSDSKLIKIYEIMLSSKSNLYIANKKLRQCYKTSTDWKLYFLWIVMIFWWIKTNFFEHLLITSMIWDFSPTSHENT